MTALDSEIVNLNVAVVVGESRRREMAKTCSPGCLTFE
jgi:hypothetical protein